MVHVRHDIVVSRAETYAGYTSRELDVPGGMSGTCNCEGEEAKNLLEKLSAQIHIWDNVAVSFFATVILKVAGLRFDIFLCDTVCHDHLPVCVPWLLHGTGLQKIDGTKKMDLYLVDNHIWDSCHM